ncbi:MAG: alpha/beta hydrolase [Gammaproteobacteria bacterium]|jgi:acetyl esterase|nr:alpha/beta hydrolase [Gammaproteobacteria bacterium]
MSSSGEGKAADRMDPQLRIFVQQVAADYAKHGPFDQLSLSVARQVAEQVRAPWRRGGPVMRSTHETHVPCGSGRVRVRIYDPMERADPLRPALVYMHGGGWTIFSLDTHDRVMREYAERANVIVIGVDYALSPEWKFPTALEQVVEVVRWLNRYGGEMGVDPARVTLGGDSAGGNLALTAALKLRDAADRYALAGILVNYGAFEADCSEESDRQYGGEGFMLSRGELQGFWENYLGSPADADNPLACPLNADLKGLPPVFLAIAECDVLCEQNVSMAERLRHAGVAVTSHVYPGTPHSFLEAVSIAQVSARALDDAAIWLKHVTMRNG